MERSNGLNTLTWRHHDRSDLRYASDLADREWSMVEPFMPSQPPQGRKRKTSLRAVMDAIFYLLQSEIHKGGGDYFLFVKGNQPEPEAELIHAFGDDSPLKTGQPARAGT